MSEGIGRRVSRFPPSLWFWCFGCSPPLLFCFCFLSARARHGPTGPFAQTAMVATLGMAMDSKTVFSTALKELGLDVLEEKFVENGWDTYGDFAFATSDPTGKNAELSQREVVDEILPKDGSLKRLIPKLRRLYAQSYLSATTTLNENVNPTTTEQKAIMHPDDRHARTESLRTRMTGFTLSGPNLPSHALIDRFTTILQKKVVKHVPWEKSTSREQELLDETEVRGLKLSPEGLLIQDVAPELATSLAGEFLWDYAMRRRSGAGDVSGLVPFSVLDNWTETMKSYLLAQPPPGYRAVSWAQLHNADRQLWKMVAADCENGTGAKPGETRTAFEKSFATRMLDPDVRACLQFLPSGSGAASSNQAAGPAAASTATAASPAMAVRDTTHSELQKLRNRLENTEMALKNAKRKLENPDGPRRGGPKAQARPRRGRIPAGWGDLPTMTPERKNICFSYNLKTCPHARAGEACFRGMHVCPKCFEGHPLRECNQRPR